MNASPLDTIAAVSTPPGEGGIGVVRISGPHALGVAARVFRARSGSGVEDQKSHTVKLGRVFHPGRPEDIIDEGLLLVLRGPKSYTREDTAEISVHGGPAVLKAVLGAVFAAGARAARPGEFTERAFLNGRLDLVQAEAVLDLIRAKTDRARRIAAAQLSGALSQRASAVRAGVIEALSHLEASIDFPDDFPDARSLPESAARFEALAGETDGLLRGASRGILARRGASVILAGRPNVGKSSLMNRLCRRDRVIVAEIPGTTRDIVEEEIDLGGFPVRVSDTAGIHEGAGPLEREGVERARAALETADVIVFVVDASRSFTGEDSALLESLPPRPVLCALNKSDLPPQIDASRLGTRRAVSCSCVTERGTEALENEILSLVTGGEAGISDEPLVSSARQKDALEKTAAALRAAAAAARQGLSPELVAVDARQALEALSELAGETVPDDVLQSLFSRFCIGK